MSPEALRRVVAATWIIRLAIIAIEMLIALGCIVLAISTRLWPVLLMTVLLGGLAAVQLRRYRRDRARAADRGGVVGPRV